MKRISCDNCQNSCCLIKKNLRPEWSDLIDQGKYQAYYRKDYSIISSGSPVAGLHIVQSGMIMEYLLRPHNDIEIVRFVNEGKVFGQAGFENNTYTFGADAKVDTIVCFFLNEALDEMYTLNSRLLYDLMTYHSGAHSESTYRLLCLSQMNLREKIASVLSYLYGSFGLTGNGELPEYFTRDDIASLACTTSEQVSRQLSDFQKEAIIEKRSRRIAILQPETLKDIIKDYTLSPKSEEAYISK